MDETFYATLVELARLGSVGVGVVVFLMVFLLLLRAKPVDEPTARLREKFLVWGTVFAAFTAVVALAAPLIQGGSGPLALRLSFSPDFESEKLPPPKVILPNGQGTEPEKNFILRPSSESQVVTVRVDATLKEVQALRKASEALTASIGTAQDQVAALATQVQAPTAAQQDLVRETVETKALQTDVAASLRAGDYARANVLSNRLRSSVRKADSIVETIAPPPGQ